MDIEHIVVLMLENNSFDRMLGSVPGVDGVDPAHPRTNPDLNGALVPERTTTMRTMLCDPADPNSKKIDPSHDLPDVLEQMSGGNQGFVKNFERNNSQCKPDAWAEVMKYYGLGSLPVLHLLARSFAVCDQWFSSLPGPTWPNRYFVHSGTSLGHVDMPEGIFHPNLHWYNQDTVYDRLDTAGKSWAIYYGDVPQTLTMTHMLGHPTHFHTMGKFFTDASGPEAAFPQYSFIEPTYFGAQQNDQHPPSDVLRGEVLLAQVYNAIRANQALWEKTLLVVSYDEHGGFYDHVTPPACVPPDQHVSEFSFAQYGIRVPAVLISPWLEAQVISDGFDHTSLLKYVTDLWGLGPLGARTAAAKSFASSWKVAAAVRTDVPGRIPEPTTLPNPEVDGLNPNQLALVGFSRYLETKTVALSAKKGPTAAKAMTMAVAQRMLRSTAQDTHGEVAVQRVAEFLKLARQIPIDPKTGEPVAGKPTRAKKAPAKRAAKKTAAKKAKKVSARAVSKKAARPAAKKATKSAAKKAGANSGKKGAKKKSAKRR
ncbi:MAG TPA: alkaline phosphatase family protein [Acidobacteriaceae bacterium]